MDKENMSNTNFIDDVGDKDGIKWLDEEVFLLLSCWKDKLSDLRKTTRKIKIHKIMAESISKGTNRKITEKHVKIKMDNLTKQYRKQKRDHGASGSYPSIWKFFKEMHSLLGNLPVNDHSLRIQSKIFPEEPSIPMKTDDTIPIPMEAVDEVPIPMEMVKESRSVAGAQDDYFNKMCFLDEKDNRNGSGTNTLANEDGNKNLVSTERQTFQPPKVKIANNAVKRKREKLVEADKNIMSTKDDDWEVIGKSIGLQLKTLPTHQQTIAQKIIADAIFYGKINKLIEESCITLNPLIPLTSLSSSPSETYYLLTSKNSTLVPSKSP